MVITAPEILFQLEIKMKHGFEKLLAKEKEIPEQFGLQEKFPMDLFQVMPIKLELQRFL